MKQNYAQKIYFLVVNKGRSTGTDKSGGKDGQMTGA
jgi:hypothetical protein